MTAERLDWDGADVAGTAARLRARIAPPEGLAERVAEIIADVRDRGDEALLELSELLDGVRPRALRVPDEELDAAREGLAPDLAEALELAAANVREVAAAEQPGGFDATLPQGQRISAVERPVASAGAYAPGGRAAYPSSVLMCCVPAREAGVRRVALASPPGANGAVARPTLAAAAIAGVDEVYALGGAHAVAALALGTETVAPVDVVVGPGSPWVTEAKRQLFGSVGIDGLAGPSELVVVLDAAADPRRLALDLLAQAEHGPDSLLVAIAADAAALAALAEGLQTAREAPSVAASPVALVRAPDREAALALADALAPEHLELALTGAGHELAAERLAGCVFVGAGAATAFGDYAAGSNHVLPTGGAARFSGALGPRAFLRRTTVVSMGSEAAAALTPAVEAIASAEGLPLHGDSARARAGG